MLINIKHLPKHAVFAELYNYAETFDPISLGEAKTIIENYKPDHIIIGPGPLWFDYFNAKEYLNGGSGSAWGTYLKTDFSDNILDTERFDDKYGAGKAEELINKLKKSRVIELENQLKPILLSPIEQLLGTEREIPVIPNADKLVEALRELRIDIDYYERIQQAKLLAAEKSKITAALEEKTSPSQRNKLFSNSVTESTPAQKRTASNESCLIM